MRTLRTTALGLALGLCATMPAMAKEQPGFEKISPFLKEQMSKKKARELAALVILKDQASLQGLSDIADRKTRVSSVYERLTTVAKDSQTGLVTWLTSQKVDFQRYHIVNMIALYDASADVIAEVAKRDDVQKIIANPVFKSLPIVTKEGDAAKRKTSSIEASLVSIGADKVWSEHKVTGEGIVVAGQDTGVEWQHPALAQAYRGTQGGGTDHAYSWHDAITAPLASGSNPCGIATTAPCDDNQHGTHTVGTIVGDDKRGNQIGVAPGAKWIACRNMERGAGRPSTYIDCFEWFLAPYPQGGNALTDGKPEMAPHVINNSWGCPPEEGCHDAEILPVLDAMKAAGIMVVASAGNTGSSCSTISDPPAMHSAGTFSVGAHDHRNGKIASFSSRGPSKFDGEVGPDVTAPGVSIRSAIPGGGFSGSFWSGTSMAGPHVVGVVALIWSAKPELIGKIEETEALIRATATPTQSNQTCGGIAGTEIPNNTFGYGRVDAYKAVSTALGK